jgi:hypothetical protein
MVRLSGSLDGVSFMDFNLLGDTACAAKRCCLEMATGYARRRPLAGAAGGASAHREPRTA